jgi:hypothetical protein
MKIADLKEAEFYKTILCVTEHILKDWNISLRPLESETAFGVIFNSLEDPKTFGKKESLTVNPYRREILVFYDGHDLAAEVLRGAYKSSTDIDFTVIH